MQQTNMTRDVDVDPDLDTERVLPSDPRSGVVSIDVQRMGGIPCFTGTRVPIRTLWDYLEGGSTIEEFLEDYEGVGREQALAAMELSLRRLIPESSSR